MTPEEIMMVRVGQDPPAGRELIGGKASSLISLSEAGANVPPAFVLTTSLFREWSKDGANELIDDLIGRGIEFLEKESGRRFGQGEDGLIVSVRSGAPISMPGMMDTVLNVGIAPEQARTNSFWRDSRRRYLLQFAEVVCGLETPPLDTVSDVDPDELERDLRSQVDGGALTWPEGPWGDLRAVAVAVFRSWDSERAKLYRKMNGIPDDMGTAVTVQAMAFGNRDSESGSGVAFTRNANDGEPGLVGEFIRGGQGEDVVSGRSTPADISAWRDFQPEAYAELSDLGKKLELNAQKVMEMEFTVESGVLYLLQTRPAKLTVQAATQIATDMVEEGLIGEADAVAYATEHGFDATAETHSYEVESDATSIARGIPVGGGVTYGSAAFSPQEVFKRWQSGEPAILVADETTPKHLPAMQRSSGIVTLRGGATSHAAVVARELGKPCVVGVGGGKPDGLIELESLISEGQMLTVDGGSGEVFLGQVVRETSTSSAVEQKLKGWATNE